jgi:hypothetical protein
MGVLTAADAIQAKTGSQTGTAINVSLDSGTQEGSTVIIELVGAGTSMTDGGEEGKVPAGFEFDGLASLTGLRYLWVFRKCPVSAGEGVSGSTSWDFTPGISSDWSWRVTEWGPNLEPVSPLERVISNTATGASVSSLSTGTAAAPDRDPVVALAMHCWRRAANTGTVYDWINHTNGFVERDQVRRSVGVSEQLISWSWAFLTGSGSIECTATISPTPGGAGDFFFALLIVYAATTTA